MVERAMRELVGLNGFPVADMADHAIGRHQQSNILTTSRPFRKLARVLPAYLVRAKELRNLVASAEFTQALLPSTTTSYLRLPTI